MTQSSGPLWLQVFAFLSFEEKSALQKVKGVYSDLGTIHHCHNALVEADHSNRSHEFWGNPCEIVGLFFALLT